MLQLLQRNNLQILSGQPCWSALLACEEEGGYGALVPAGVNSHATSLKPPKLASQDSRCILCSAALVAH